MLERLAVIIGIFIKMSIAIQCNPDLDDQVRLVNGTTLQEGRLEVCFDSTWITVCDDNWRQSNVLVVCRQLGYEERAGRAIYGSYFGPGVGPMVLNNVNCNGRESQFLNCPHHELVPLSYGQPANDHCNHNEDISVQCILKEEQRVKNITLSVEIINAPSTGVHTALISWVLYNNTVDEPSSFDIKCSNKWHSITMSVNSQTFTTYLLGLLPLTSYNCCVSAVYELYVADGVCKNITTPELFITTYTLITKLSNTESNDIVLVGGVLGSIIVILIILLTVALVYLLCRTKWKRNASPSRLSQSVGHGRNRTTDMPVCSNQSYLKAPYQSDLTTKTEAYPSQATAAQDSNQLEGGAGADYSSIGPDYETIDSRRQSQRKFQFPAAGQLSGRYEFSEAHLATLNESVPGGSANYEIPLNLRQNESTEDEDYSHLKH